MKQPSDSDFALVVNFPPGTENPSRIFGAITELIEAFSSFDAELIKSVDVNLKPVLVLEDIQGGSIRIWFGNLLKALDDDGIKNLDWKPLIGQYLVKGKYMILKAIERTPTISSRKELIGLRDELQQLAESTSTNKLFPTAAPIELPRLITGMRQVSSALSRLGPGETAEYETTEGKVSVNPAFRLTDEEFEQLLTAETIISISLMILKVKKPDYLGESMWEFRHEGRSVQARVEDIGWLRRFQNREIDVRPGDAIRASVRVEVKYGFDGDVVAKHHIIERVDDVLRYNPKQDGLFPTGG
jgi:hypothetical protein